MVNIYEKLLVGIILLLLKSVVFSLTIYIKECLHWTWSGGCLG